MVAILVYLSLYSMAFRQNENIVLILTVVVALCHCQTIHDGSFVVCQKREIDSVAVKVVKVRSRIQCAGACMADDSCTASNFHKNNLACEIFTSDIYFKETCADFGAEAGATALKKIPKPEPCTSEYMSKTCQYDQPYNATGCLCLCEDGFTGEYCENPPRDCSDFSSNGYKWIYLPETDVKLRVVCSGGMMYILQFNESYNAFQEYGNSGWNAFKSGFNFFGSQQYWIGHDVIHNITTKTNHTYTLVMYVMRAPIWITSYYYDFHLSDEANNYTIYFSGSKVSTQGSETLENNSQFRTADYNSNKCTILYGAAWWYPQYCPLPSIFSGNYAIDGVTKDIYDLVLNLKRQ